MNKKGLYSGGVALATIVLVIAISFNITSTVQAEETQGTADNIIDAKWEMQNAGHLTEEAVVDAMVDAIFATCSYEVDAIKSKINTYVPAYYLETQNECRIGSTIEFASTTATSTAINFELECNTNATSGLTTNYKKTITFNKKATISPNMPEIGKCTVIIEEVYESQERPFNQDVEIIGEIT